MLVKYCFHTVLQHLPYLTASTGRVQCSSEMKKMKLLWDYWFNTCLVSYLIKCMCNIYNSKKKWELKFIYVPQNHIRINALHSKQGQLYLFWFTFVQVTKYCIICKLPCVYVYRYIIYSASWRLKPCDNFRLKT